MLCNVLESSVQGSQKIGDGFSEVVRTATCQSVWNPSCISILIFINPSTKKTSLSCKCVQVVYVSLPYQDEVYHVLWDTDEVMHNVALPIPISHNHDRFGG